MRVTADSGSSIPGYMKVTADSGCSIPIKMSTVPNSVPTRKFGLSRNRNRNYFSCFLSKNFNVFAHICLYCVYLVLNAFFTSKMTKIPQILIQSGSNPRRKYPVRIWNSFNEVSILGRRYFLEIASKVGKKLNFANFFQLWGRFQGNPYILRGRS